jgi:MoaA/NifB/PqqE/SkfB family radical SAM enzyme
MPRNLKNRIALIHDYLRRRPRLKAFPFEVQIGITNRCNLDCVFCPHRFSKKKKGNMELDLLDHILTQVYPYVDTVDLSFDGEPFLHPNWVECIEACHRHKINPMLETNAMLMDEGLSREILAVGISSITFSIDASTSETYSKLKPSGDFRMVVSNVEKFLSLAGRVERKRKPYIQIQFVRTDENSSEAGQFLRQWQGKGADVVHIKPMLNFAGSVGPPPATPAQRPCLFLWTSLAIQYDGVVPICCLEIEGRTDMGNARDQSLKEIINSPGFISARTLHGKGAYREHPICRKCSVPSVAWPYLLGAAVVGDMSRRKIINLMEQFFPVSGRSDRSEKSLHLDDRPALREPDVAVKRKNEGINR